VRLQLLQERFLNMLLMPFNTELGFAAPAYKPDPESSQSTSEMVRNPLWRRLFHFRYGLQK
jgi:hypothetical protein